MVQKSESRLYYSTESYTNLHKVLHNGSQAANLQTQRKHSAATQSTGMVWGAGETLATRLHL